MTNDEIRMTNARAIERTTVIRQSSRHGHWSSSCESLRPQQHRNLIDDRVQQVAGRSEKAAVERLLERRPACVPQLAVIE